MLNSRARRLFPWRSLWALLLITVSLPLTAAQAPTAKIASDTATKYERGLLWRVESPGVAPSFLFGTLHSDDPRITRLPAPVRQAFDGAKSLTLELLLDAGAMASMAERMFYTDGRTLPGVVGAELYARAREVLREEGVPDVGLERQKPWVVVMMLSMPRPKHGPFLDALLQAQATEQRKPVYGLETIAEQLAVFDDMAQADQVMLLKETLASHKQMRALLEELTQSYLARDLGQLMRVADRYRPADSRVYDRLMQRLLADRNRIMAERMVPRLKEGNAFIAIGAAHLPGANGVLDRLERAGYRLHAVY